MFSLFNRSHLKYSYSNQGRIMNSVRRKNKEENAESCISHNLLTILTIASVVGGVGLGFILKGSKSELVLKLILKISALIFYI